MNPNNNFSHLLLEESKDLMPRIKNEIKKYSIEKIKDYYAIVCLIGQDTYSSDWVNYKLEYVLST